MVALLTQGIWRLTQIMIWWSSGHTCSSVAPLSVSSFPRPLSLSHSLPSSFSSIWTLNFLGNRWVPASVSTSCPNHSNLPRQTSGMNMKSSKSQRHFKAVRKNDGIHLPLSPFGKSINHLHAIDSSVKARSVYQLRNYSGFISESVIFAPLIGTTKNNDCYLKILSMNSLTSFYRLQICNANLLKHRARRMNQCSFKGSPSPESRSAAH